MPRPASDRRLLTTTQRATRVLEEELKGLRQAVKRHGDLWHVRILDWGSDEGDDRPYLAVDFVIGERDGRLEIAKWSITGHEILTTRQSRFPLQTYARAALFAAEDALAADDVLTYEAIMAQELPYIRSLTEDEAGSRGWVYKEFRIVDGRIRDARARKPRQRPRRKHVTAKDDELDTRIPRAVEAYRRAIERGSRSPTVDVARALNVGRSTAARALSDAREQGLLGPALRNRAGEGPN
jgi:hypothetical protein